MLRFPELTKPRANISKLLISIVLPAAQMSGLFQFSAALLMFTCLFDFY